MPRGGRRPGAGGKPGNLNALKHGHNSLLVQRLIAYLVSVPETRAALLALARRQRAQRRQAERTAATLLYTLLDEALANLKNDQSRSPRSDSQRILSALLDGKTIKHQIPSPQNHQTVNPAPNTSHLTPNTLPHTNLEGRTLPGPAPIIERAAC